MAETISQLNAERAEQMTEIVAARERHVEAIARIDAQLQRSKREPTDRHQLLIGLAVWLALSFAAAFASHAYGADLTQIEIDLVIADFAFILAAIFWIAGTAVLGVVKESAAANLAVNARETQTQQLAADIAAAEGSIREIDATLDRIRSRTPFLSKQEPATGAMKINPVDGAEMVYVPAGTFIMGTEMREIDDVPLGSSGQDIPRAFYMNCITDNGPRREIQLDGYWIYKYPVTVGQYRQFCTETGSTMPRSTAEVDDDLGDRHPIDHLTWHAAKAYCDWAGVRLCTEAEWEKALRGNEGWRYPWGDAWVPTLSARVDDSDNRTPVEAFDDLAGPFGAVGFYGEGSQWCDDLYLEAAWTDSPRHNPRGPASNTTGDRVIRGGGCGDDPLGYIVAKRYHSDPLKRGQCGIQPVSDG